MGNRFESYFAIMEGQKEIAKLLDDPTTTDERAKELLENWARNNKILDEEAKYIYESEYKKLR